MIYRLHAPAAALALAALLCLSGCGRGKTSPPPPPAAALPVDQSRGKTSPPQQLASAPPVDPSPSPRYAREYTKLVSEFRAAMKRLNSNKVRASESDPKTWPAMAKDLEETSSAAAGFAARLKLLSPPPERRELHDATLAFMEAIAGGDGRAAQRLRAGDIEGTKSAGEESMQAVQAAGMRWSSASRKLKGETR